MLVPIVFNKYSPGLATKAQEPFGSVSLVVNYFVVLDFALLVGFYLFLIRKILFQMAYAKRKCTFTSEMQEKHPCFRKGRHDYEAECLVCKSGTYISVVHKGNGDLKTLLQSEKHRKTVAYMRLLH